MVFVSAFSYVFKVSSYKRKSGIKYSKQRHKFLKFYEFSNSKEKNMYDKSVTVKTYIFILYHKNYDKR